MCMYMVCVCVERAMRQKKKTEREKRKQGSEKKEQAIDIVCEQAMVRRSLSVYVRMSGIAHGSTCSLCFVHTNKFSMLNASSYSIFMYTLH